MKYGKSRTSDVPRLGVIKVTCRQLLHISNEPRASPWVFERKVAAHSANVSSKLQPPWQTQKRPLLVIFRSLLKDGGRNSVPSLSCPLPGVTRNDQSMYQNFLRTPHRKPFGNSSGAIG